ncbi:MAG: hypothetical protein GY941_24390 [Planctomycetes bacterium]|nr:hypothetical protein [Planctomycetota bacterium]
MKLDGIWGGSASYPGKPSCAGIYVAQGIIKPNRIGEPEAGQGTEGGRFTDSTEDSGPMKPGNSVEDKTLTTRKAGHGKNV